MKKRLVSLFLSLSLLVLTPLTVLADTTTDSNLEYDSNGNLIPIETVVENGEGSSGLISNSRSRLAMVHTATIYWDSNGTRGWVTGKTYNGSKVNYFEADIWSSYNFDAVTRSAIGNYGYNIPRITSPYAYESGPNRRFYGKTCCQNTSSSGYEYLYGQSSLFN